MSQLFFRFHDFEISPCFHSKQSALQCIKWYAISYYIVFLYSIFVNIYLYHYYSLYILSICKCRQLSGCLCIFESALRPAQDALHTTQGTLRGHWKASDGLTAFRPFDHLLPSNAHAENKTALGEQALPGCFLFCMVAVILISLRTAVRDVRL